MDSANPNQEEIEAKQEKSVFTATHLMISLLAVLLVVCAWLVFDRIIKERAENDPSNWALPEQRDVNEQETVEDDAAPPPNIEAEYLSSSYRIVRVVENPYYYEESKYDTLVVASPRGVNDYTCGGMYVPSTCYLFLESSYARTETPLFVGTWDGGNHLLHPETIEFISPTKIRFNASFGDGGVRSDTVWEYDLISGSSTRVSLEQDLRI